MLHIVHIQQAYQLLELWWRSRYPPHEGFDTIKKSFFSAFRRGGGIKSKNDEESSSSESSEDEEALQKMNQGLEQMGELYKNMQKLIADQNSKSEMKKKKKMI